MEITALVLPGNYGHASADDLDIVDGKAQWKRESFDYEGETLHSKETFAFPELCREYFGLQQPAAFLLQQPGDGT